MEFGEAFQILFEELVSQAYQIIEHLSNMYIFKR